MSARRDAQESVDSWTGSLEIAMERSLQLEEKLQKEEDAETPQELLRRMLSARSAISTASSFARSQQEAVGTRAEFREIGVGSIGRVFEHPGTPWAFEVLLIDRTTKLWNNYIMHLRIQQGFDILGEVAGLVDAQALWTVFCRRYIATGQKTTTGTAWQSLPAKFIQGIMDELSHLGNLRPSGSSQQAPSGNTTRRERGQRRGEGVKSGRGGRGRGGSRG